LEILSSIVVAAGASVSMGLWYRYRRKQAWRVLARKRGLKIVGGGVNGLPELVGEIDGYPVRVWVRELEPSVQFTVVDVAEQTLTRSGFERDLNVLIGLLDEALRRADRDAEDGQGRSPF
jgi:hypothetical protein